MDILILGIGNVLMGDEGIGVHSIQYLENQTFPSNVRLLDGGTGGFHLLEYLQIYKKIIMIDATMDGSHPGTIKVIKPKFSTDFPKALSAHDIGLKDLVESAALLGSLPEIHLITVAITKIQSMTMELSPEISSTFPLIHTKINEILDSLS
jgi:hydrogenase maturation protease